MKKVIYLLFILLLLLNVQSCSDRKVLDMDNLYAWCIVPFDNQNRTPEQRIRMLQELGFKAYAYDWREENLADMAHELKLAKNNGIDVIGVWMWIDRQDATGNLSDNNQKVFQILAENQLKTQIWVSLSENFFDDMTNEQKTEEAAEMISYLSLEAEDIGCRIGLYNHGGWFGKPQNLVNIIKSMPMLDIGIIFNFHHAHDMIEKFPEVAAIMKPHLWAVNLNGMKPEGPKILTIGEGTKEEYMVKVLEENGYKGPYGILGHVENADVKKILEANLKGLKSLPHKH